MKKMTKAEPGVRVLAAERQANMMTDQYQAVLARVSQRLEALRTRRGTERVTVAQVRRWLAQIWI